MSSLIAQAETAATAWGAGLAACAFFGFLTVVSVAGVWQDRKKNELAHAERMKRIERDLPDLPPESAWPKALVCASIGAGVPVAAYVTTLIAYLQRGDLGSNDDIWVGPMAVSVVSVIVGGLLSHRLFLGGKSTRPDPAADSKPLADPDELDVVGRRG